MQYVVILEINENELDGDDSIENACSIANHTFTILQRNSALPDGAPITVRPLSEVIAA